MFRKFYEATTEGGGGEPVVAEKLSAVEAMAKFGSKSDENSVEKLVDINEKKEEEKPIVKEEPAAKVEETKTDEKAASEISQETKTSTEEPKKEAAEPIVQEQPAKGQTLEEVLKNNQPDTVLKALGFDDKKVSFIQELGDVDPKIIGIIEAWKDGKLGDYVKELATDYSKMPAEEVMRHQLRLEYPKANEKQLDILYKKEIIEKYDLDSDDETELEEGRELLAAKADKYRDSFIENQNKFLLPPTPEPKKEQPADNTAQVQAQQNVDSYVKAIKEDDFTKNIIADKKLTLGEGKEKFTYPIDTDLVIGAMTDPNMIAELMMKKVTAADGKETVVLDTKKQFLSAMIQVYGEDFLNAYGLHMKGTGGKEVSELIDNASDKEKVTTSKSDILPTSAAGLMAKTGVRRG